MRSLKITIVIPDSSPTIETGNRVTAERWASMLRSLGHRVKITTKWDGAPCDLLVALHARRSSSSIKRFSQRHPEAPLIVALTGTDLYAEIHRSVRARESLDLATRLVILQPEGRRELSARFARKARVIRQSAVGPPGRVAPRRDIFEVCLLCHARAVKDPFRAALAARRLPAASRIRIVHLGAALDGGMEKRAQLEERRNRRYVWLGPAPRSRALRILKRCRLLVLTSRIEGGGNAIAEALACGVPVVASRISGVIGTLGQGYPGYFEVGDTEGLARLLLRAETDRRFYERLKSWCRRLGPLVAPNVERQAWIRLLKELKPGLPRR